MKERTANNEKTRTRVIINDQEYIVRGQYSSDHVKELANHVDDKMQALKNRDPYLTPAKLAILTALNIADEYYHLRSEYEEILKFVKEEKSE